MPATTMVELNEPAHRSVTLAEQHLRPVRRHDSNTARDRALFEYFVAARARERTPIICLNRDVMYASAAAVHLVRDSDKSTLWAWARHAINRNDRSVHPLTVHGQDLSAQFEPILARYRLIGAAIRLAAPAQPTTRAQPAPTPRRASRAFGWDSLRESELGVAQLVAEGLTNRQIGSRLFLSPHTVDSHLRHIFQKLEINSRIELTRIVVEHARLHDSSVA